jgi:hypothetical protein
MQGGVPVRFSLSFRLELGRGERSITDRGEGREVVNPIAFSVGTRRSITFVCCKVDGGDVEISGQKIRELSFRVYIFEQQTTDERQWPEAWKIGMIFDSVSLFLSPVAFQQLWETAEGPENGRPVVELYAHPDPDGAFYVSGIRLKVRPPRPHPVVMEIERLRQQFRQIIVPWILGLFAALIAVEFIRWLWR